MGIWIDNVEKRLIKLEENKIININELSERKEFSALLLRAIQISAVTSQEDLLNDLSNYIINLSKGPDISEDELYIILETLGSFTPSHIKALKFYSSPCDYKPQIINYMKITKENIGPGYEMAYIFGEGSSDFWQSIFIMINVKNLVTVGTTMIEPNSPDLVVSSKVTELGKHIVTMIDNTDKV